MGLTFYVGKPHLEYIPVQTEGWPLRNKASIKLLF
jgi:hypothetical protein